MAIVGAMIEAPTAIVLVRADTEPTFEDGTLNSKIKSIVLNQPPTLVITMTFAM